MKWQLVAYCLIPEYWINFSSWLNERVGTLHWLPTEEKHWHTPCALGTLTATDGCSTSPRLCRLRFSPPTDLFPSTGGSRPRENKWLQPRDTPPCIPNDVTLTRIWKLLFWNYINHQATEEWILRCRSAAAVRVAPYQCGHHLETRTARQQFNPLLKRVQCAFTSEELCICPHSVFMCFTQFSE
jgi:hypothetical protein